MSDLSTQLADALADRDALLESRQQALATLAAVQNSMTAMKAALDAQGALLGTLVARCDAATLADLPPDMKAVAMRYRTVH